MKNAPYRLAFFGLFITILRIMMLVAIIDSGFGPLLGKIFAGAFAVFIAGGVYVSSFFVRPVKTRWAGLSGLLLFGLADLWFNEATVVYYTSAASLVPPESNFMGITAASIRYFMQFTALLFGLLPTLGAAVLGWMQSGAAEVAILNKPGTWGRIGAAFGRIVVGWGVKVAIGFEAVARNAPQQGNNSPQSDRQNLAVRGQIAPRRWHSLTADETAFIRQSNRAEIMATFGISDGAAGDWKRRVDAGEKPWQK